MAVAGYWAINRKGKTAEKAEILYCTYKRSCYMGAICMVIIDENGKWEDSILDWLQIRAFSI